MRRMTKAFRRAERRYNAITGKHVCPVCGRKCTSTIWSHFAYCSITCRERAGAVTP
jgi:hypothetical protein